MTALLLAPGVAAEPGFGNVRECVFGPIIPERFIYYTAWGAANCLLGTNIPEPIRQTTGCYVGFPATDIHCPVDIDG